MELREGKGGIETRFFNIEAGELETGLDGLAENETSQDGGGSDGIDGEMGGNVDATSGDGFGEVAIRERPIGDMDDFVGVNGV